MTLLIEPEVSGTTIVLRGNFNPSIFQPFWMAKQGLISDEAAAAADVSVIHPEISRFSIQPEFILDVQTERFAISRATAPLVVVADLCARIFGDVLPHTPISQMGINRSVHFSVGSGNERNRIGRLLAPTAPWGAWGKDLESDDPMKNGGLQSLAKINKKVGDRESGWVRVKLGPSESIKGNSGIVMEINDHYQFKDTTDALVMMGILQKRFDASMAEAENLINQIMSLKS